MKGVTLSETLPSAATDAIIRMAEVDDSRAILDIYAPYIEQTTITLTSQIPSIDEIAKTMMAVKRQYPYLVCCVGSKVVGFAYAHRIRPHEAYLWNAELSVYILPEYQGRGVGTALYTALFQILKVQGFCNLYAVITLPSDASIALHKHFGFTETCVQKAVGYKLGEWRDVLWMELRIEGAIDPGVHGPPHLLKDVRPNDIDTALALAATLLVSAKQ